MASPHRNSPVSFAPCTHCSDSSTGPQFLFTDVAHSKDLVTALRFLRQDEDLCDIVLRVGSTSISAHKVVLAASSPYFKAMFAGKILEHACLLASFTEEQGTKKFRSDIPGLVNFVVGLVEFILHLLDGQVKVFGEIFL